MNQDGGSRALITTGLTLLACSTAACGGRYTDERNASGSVSSGNAGAVATVAGGAPGALVGGAPGAAGAVAGGAPGAVAGGAPSAAAGGAPVTGTGVLLIPTDGWIDSHSNALMVQGAVYSRADSWSTLSMTSDFTGTYACIRGATAPLDPHCQPTDCCKLGRCTGEVWGAAISLNFNQYMESSPPNAYDGSALKGFSFELSGSVPKSLEFQFESYTDTYCGSPPSKVVRLGANTALFSELFANCFHPGQPPAPFDSALLAETSKLIRISWLVPADHTTEVPYDFCVSNIRALYK